jgi:predicted DNA-binding antitoxin AbrB/MazE fold protein
MEINAMIRAIVNNGIIQPLEPIPNNWRNGQEVVVDDTIELMQDDAQSIDKWLDDMDMLTAELNDAEEWREIEATLAESDRQQKALMRREMGLKQ